MLSKLFTKLNFWMFAVGVSAGVASADEPQRTDLMAFAQGTLPIAVSTGAVDRKVGMEHAILAIDGNPQGYVASRKPAASDDIFTFTFALPALTRFEGFSIPNIKETPSPSQTFFRKIEVVGSAVGPDGPFEPLATAELSTHEDENQRTELTMVASTPEVRWVSLILSDGIDVQKDVSFFEFSEIIGVGTQQDPELSDRFRGVWSGRGVKLELEQDGATVTGCYDNNSMLSGTVQGNVLRALGSDDAGISSQFILIATEDGSIRGLRSTNGAPFRQYDGDISNKAPKCLAPEKPTLGCGSIVHGIGFDYDSDTIRPSSEVLIASLYDGLLQDAGTDIQIIGHSSSEGADDYNRDLSQRRAQSVVGALIAMGLDTNQISAAGRGEDEPIASNDDEAGRSLNRRVEVRCSAG